MRTHQNRQGIIRLFLMASTLFLFIGCQQEKKEVLKDPPVDRGSQAATDGLNQERTIDIGFYNEQLFDPLSDGGELPIVNGTQGGEWMMPTIRVTGMNPKASVDCVVKLQDDQIVGEASGIQVLKRNNDQSFEIENYAIPVTFSGDLSTLGGREGQIKCTVVDERNVELEITRSIKLRIG